MNINEGLTLSNYSSLGEERTEEEGRRVEGDGMREKAGGRKHREICISSQKMCH